MYPGLILLPITNFIVPSWLIYWLFPEGGPEAMIGLSSIVALLFWWLIAAIVIHLSSRIRKYWHALP